MSRTALEPACEALYHYLLVVTRGNEDLSRELLQTTMAACLIIVWCLSFVVLRQPGPGPVKFPCEAVRSVPLTSGEVVTTTGFMAALVKTVPGGLARTGIEFVQTDPQFHGTDFISDQQLLALFQGHPLALVNPGPGKKQLRFLN